MCDKVCIKKGVMPEMSHSFDMSIVYTYNKSWNGFMLITTSWMTLVCCNLLMLSMTSALRKHISNKSTMMVDMQPSLAGHLCLWAGTAPAMFSASFFPELHSAMVFHTCNLVEVMRFGNLRAARTPVHLPFQVRIVLWCFVEMRWAAPKAWPIICHGRFILSDTGWMYIFLRVGDACQIMWGRAYVQVWRSLNKLRQMIYIYIYTKVFFLMHIYHM